MDKSIHALMQFMRSKMADRLLKIHKGKWTRHLRDIRKRHQTSLNLRADAVTCLNNNNAYLVRGSGDAVYMVEQCVNVPHTADTCPLMCEECAICIHRFHCNCLDSGLRSTICKHVHLVMRVCCPQLPSAMSKSSSGSESPRHGESDVMDTACLCYDDVPSAAVEETVEQTLDPVPLDETTAILASFKQHQPQCSLITLDQHCADIRAAVVQNPELLSDACVQLMRVKAFLAAARTKPAVPRLPLATSKDPANKKMTQQRHFSSTRKQHKRKPESTLSKPDAAEKALLLQTLDGNVEVVSRVAGTADHDYDTGAGDTVLFEHCYAGGRQ